MVSPEKGKKKEKKEEGGITMQEIGREEEEGKEQEQELMLLEEPPEGAVPSQPRAPKFIDEDVFITSITVARDSAAKQIRDQKVEKNSDLYWDAEGDEVMSALLVLNSIQFMKNSGCLLFSSYGCMMYETQNYSYVLLPLHIDYFGKTENEHWVAIVFDTVEVCI